MLCQLCGRVGVLLKGNEYAREHNHRPVTPEIVEGFYEEIEIMNEHELSKYINLEIVKQMTDMFGGLQQNNSLSNASKFQVTCSNSDLKNAGEGVFLKCSESQVVAPGTVVALYPGYVYLKEHLKDLNFFRTLLPDPDFMLMATSDDCIIDGRSAKLMPLNPYAVGHKINHCGKNSFPNVLQARILLFL